jgi:putative peptidoglycan lipid II flippase
MTTPGSQAGPTAADGGSLPGSADRDEQPPLVRPYADPARGYFTGSDSSSGSDTFAGTDSDHRQGGTRRDAAGQDVELPPGWPGAPEPFDVSGADEDAGPAEFPGNGLSDTDPSGDWGPVLAEDPPPGEPLGAEPPPGEPLGGEPPAGELAAEANADFASADYGSAGYGNADLEDAGPANAEPGVAAAAGGPGGGTDPADTSIVRSSGVMAVGTLASRVTGFLRTAVLIYALGTHFLGDAYNIANTLPNAVYNLALGGILTSVVVPLLVSASKRYGDKGEAYDQRIFTLGVLALGGITLAATLAAAPIAGIYAHGVGSSSAHHLTIIFAYFFIPQIFFYGVSSLAGAILNSRGSFAAPMWTPVVNNVVVIVVGGAFMVTAGLNRTPSDLSAAEIGLLGIGTTLGIVLQTAALVPSLRRVGFRWRPRFDFRKSEVSEIGRMGGWMFGYVLTTQVAFLVTTQVANEAGSRVSQQSAGAGFAAYSNAWQLFQLPYAIVGISVITAMLPRMSSHAAARNYRLVADDFSAATRLASVIVVPAAVVLAVLGAPLAEVLFGYGSTSVASARYLGEIFAVFSLGLLPYMLFQLQLRVFYAMHDSRTPAIIGVATMAMNIGANYAALAILPARDVVAGLGAGFGLANLLGSVLAWRILSRRLGGLDGRNIASSLARMHASAIPPALYAIAVSLMIDVVLPTGRLGAIVIVILAGCGGLLLYVMFAKAFRVRELTDLTETVTSRFRR